jgi:hypothetical protein
VRGPSRITDYFRNLLSPDWRLGIAYNAALQLATLALAAVGYHYGDELLKVLAVA